MPKAQKARQPRQEAPGPTIGHLRDLTPDPANRRAHNPRNLGMLVDALQKVGASRSIVVDEDGVILAGNGVVEAASEAGITKLQIVEADGDTIVAVRRRGLTASQKRELAIYDNRTAELAEWNVEQLAADLKNGEDLSAFFFDDELKVLLAGAEGVKAGLTDPDAVPEERPTSIVAGDLFELGAHRLLCGDTTRAADVARVLEVARPEFLLTDPPYGRGGYAGRSGKFAAIAGDECDPQTIAAWLAGLPLFARRFIWCDWQSYPAFAGALGLPDSVIVWSKPWPSMGRGYRSQYELACFYGSFEAADQFNVWAVDYRAEGVNSTWQRTATVNLHPTQKPVELFTRALHNHASASGACDPFCGSGSSIIAGEEAGFPICAVEIEPRYCQVIIDRWEAFTGQQAVKV